MNLKKKSTHINDIGKLPPQAVDAEEVVLGALILENNSINQIIDIIKPEIFYKEAHIIICKAILRLEDREEPFDTIMLMQELKIMKKLEEVGGAYYLSQLLNRVSGTTNILYHTRIVIQKYVQRRIIQVSHNYIDKSYDDLEDTFIVLDDMVSELELLGIDKIEVSKTLPKVTAETIEDIENKNKKIVKSVYSTGQPLFDSMLGICERNVLLIGALRGHGKTIFVIDMICKLFERNDDVAALWYPMEDGSKKILRGMISREILLSDRQLQSKNFTIKQNKLEEMLVATNTIQSYDIEFVDTSSYVKNIKSNFKKFCSRRVGKLNILIIDNLMKLKDNRGHQTEADDRIASVISDIMTETNGYVIAIHHFTKDSQARDQLDNAFRPTDQHLKGSGRFPDVATQVLLINRPAKHPALMKQHKDKSDILDYMFIVDVNKNRDGKEGIVRFFGDLDYKRFQEIHPEGFQQPVKLF